MRTVWDEIAVKKLEALAAEGYSASQAALHFTDMTRNAAVGIAFRNGFHFLGRFGGDRGEPKKRHHVRSAPFMPPPREVSAAPLLPPRDGQLSLDELRYDSCRFIERDVMDPNHRYCGQTTIPDKSWCPHHATIVYQPREERRR